MRPSPKRFNSVSVLGESRQALDRERSEARLCRKGGETRPRPCLPKRWPKAGVGGEAKAREADLEV